MDRSLHRGSRNSGTWPTTPSSNSSNSFANFAKALGVAISASDEQQGLVRPKATRRSSGLAHSGALSPTSSQASRPNDPFSMGVQIHLPDSLHLVLESVCEGLLDAHLDLFEALRSRYEQQWPLVRSLADVFTPSADLLKHYATYVCHLQRALEQLEEANLMERAMRGKRIKKERLSQTVALGRAVALLESISAQHGEPSLAIFISKPFQRLLKYPLLFQNLLFHTDPSTHEFESTVAMVVEVERIVRTIEDEKVGAEERDKVRDAFARIDGINEKRLLKPRPDRTLIDERPLWEQESSRALSESARIAAQVREDSGAVSDSEAVSGNTLRNALRAKRSIRRLSDYISGDASPSKTPSVGGKKDIWLIRFSDVDIRCRRVGVTSLPMVSSAVLQPTVDSQAEDEDTYDAAGALAKREKESKERLKALRNTTLRAKTRNLYSFIAVQSWRASEKTASAQPEEYAQGLSTAMEEAEEDDESDQSSDEGVDMGRYIRQSKLSFSYWGTDRVEPRRVGSQADRGGPPGGDGVSPRSANGRAGHLAPSDAITHSQSRGKADKFASRLRPSAYPSPSSSPNPNGSSSFPQGIDQIDQTRQPSSTAAQPPAIAGDGESLVEIEPGIPFSPSGLQWPSGAPSQS